MQKFFIMTRGRTGSTAVMDSLTKSESIIAAQELFINYGVKNKKKNAHDQLLPRFDLWLDSRNLYQKLTQIFAGQSQLIKKYLVLAEKKATIEDGIAFGFKIISHHFDERPKLKELLLERNYKAIYLTRNIPRQVISGMVAKLRGKYNAHDGENYIDEASYAIDIVEFKSLVEWETQAVINDIAMLESSGFEHIQVRYEDFVGNPDAFFASIFNFLKIPEEKLPASSFSIMIKDLRQSLKNYHEIEYCLDEMGMTLE